jgi:hypothetical protein
MTSATKASRAVLVALALALSVPAALGASNLSYRATLNLWSNRIGTDAASVALAARQRHPRQMTSKAVAFHRDALRARTRLTAEKVSTSRLRRSRTAALKAFASYAQAGASWASSGRLRLEGKQTAAIAAAHTGAQYAATGSRLLITAARLAR